MSNIIPVEHIESRIYLLRGQKVMLDRDLAELYGVTTKRMNEQVKRNIKRFPYDFMFQLSEKEKNKVVANCDHLQELKFSHQLPRAFTEQGVAMLSSVLKSERAIQVNIAIMRAFVRMKQVLYTHRELALQFKLLKERVGKRLDKHDAAIADIFEVIRRMLVFESKPKPKIGFRVERGKSN